MANRQVYKPDSSSPIIAPLMQENVPPSQHEGLQSVKLSKVQELLFPQNHPGFGILSNSLAASLHMAGATLTNRLEAHKREPIDV